ncbi:MAG: hypothetical protein L3J45_04525 [Flavobacteriaceae bacterium]|nr:hypothetical protein [Flavobacteriaceae bacterium]
MKKKLKIITILTLFGIIFYSCYKDEGILKQSKLSLSEQMNNAGLKGIVLGKKLENPYSVENMKKALDNLKKSNVSAKTSVDGIEVTTTHLYVKFKPKNEDELDILKSDSTLVLYDYPLDYEIEENGDFYRDPDIPDNQPTYKYTAVKVGKKLPSGVENEILAELFIPDENSDNETSNKTVITYEMVDALVDEALHITWIIYKTKV